MSLTLRDSTNNSNIKSSLSPNSLSGRKNNGNMRTNMLQKKINNDTNIETWHSRMMEINGSLLMISKDGKLRTAISLPLCTTIILAGEVRDDLGTGTLIEIIVSEKSYVFRCTSRSEAGTWVDQLNLRRIKGAQKRALASRSAEKSKLTPSPNRNSSNNTSDSFSASKAYPSSSNIQQLMGDENSLNSNDGTTSSSSILKPRSVIFDSSSNSKKVQSRKNKLIKDRSSVKLTMSPVDEHVNESDDSTVEVDGVLSPSIDLASIGALMRNVCDEMYQLDSTSLQNCYGDGSVLSNEDPNLDKSIEITSVKDLNTSTSSAVCAVGVEVGLEMQKDGDGADGSVADMSMESSALNVEANSSDIIKSTEKNNKKENVKEEVAVTTIDGGKDDEAESLSHSPLAASNGTMTVSEAVQRLNKVWEQSGCRVNLPEPEVADVDVLDLEEPVDDGKKDAIVSDVKCPVVSATNVCVSSPSSSSSSSSSSQSPSSVSVETKKDVSTLPVATTSSRLASASRSNDTRVSKNWSSFYHLVPWILTILAIIYGITREVIVLRSQLAETQTQLRDRQSATGTYRGRGTGDDNSNSNSRSGFMHGQHGHRNGFTSEGTPMYSFDRHPESYGYNSHPRSHVHGHNNHQYGGYPRYGHDSNNHNNNHNHRFESNFHPINEQRDESKVSNTPRLPMNPFQSVARSVGRVLSHFDVRIWARKIALAIVSMMQ